MKNYQTYAIYSYQEAVDFANNLAKEANGDVVDCVVDDPCTYSFEEVDQWSGETAALKVRDYDFNTIAIIAYWE